MENCAVVPAAAENCAAAPASLLLDVRQPTDARKSQQLHLFTASACFTALAFEVLATWKIPPSTRSRRRSSPPPKRMGTSEGKPRSAASVLAGAVNIFALLGWAVLLCAAFAYFRAPLPAHFYALAVVCELICASEVVQIMIGVLRGRLALGVILHYTRLLVLLAVLSLPAVAPSLAASLVYVAWAATEVFRYPMFLSNATMVRKLRYAVPVVTFPVGAVAEAWACYLCLLYTSPSPRDS